MKKLIYLTLLLFLILNLASCFDADDIFVGDVTEDSDNLTVIEPTEEPTGESAPVAEETTTDQGMDVPIPFTEEIATFTLSPVISEDYSETIVAIKAMEKVANMQKDETTKIYDDYVGASDTNEFIKSAYSSMQGIGFGYLRFGKSISASEGMRLYVNENFHVLDGSDVGENYKDSVFVIVAYSPSSGLRNVDFVFFEDGKLMLDIDFYFERSRSTDSSLERSYVTFELDKSLFGGEEIKEVVLNFNLAFFDVCISNIENGKSRTTNFGWSGRGYVFDSIIGKRAAWSDRIDSTLTFGYTFEIIETELIGYEDDIYYKTITVPTGEKRVIKYNSELGICVEGNRSLQLTDKQNEYFKLLVSSLN